MLKQATGATKILVFAHDVRSSRQAREKGVREPVAAVHNDYTIKSGPQHVRELLEPDEAEERLKNRFAEINVWRPIRGPVQGTPLAVCDSRSIAPKDLVPTDLKHEVYMVTFNPRHRWFYFPGHGNQRGTTHQGFRFDEGWSGAVHRPCRVRGPGGVLLCPRSGKHRGPSACLLWLDSVDTETAPSLPHAVRSWWMPSSPTFNRQHP